MKERFKIVLSKVYGFISKFSYLFSALTVFLTFAIIFYKNNIYPFGELTVSWCDMDQQTIPLLCDFKDVLSGKSSFFLSLQNAGGMNFYGVYFFNLSSPFTYLVLFFSKAQMPQAVNLMVLLKLTTASLTFSIWLKHEIKNCSPLIIIPTALVYAFSGYSMMYYQILSWLDLLYIFPLLLLGLKNITEGKSILLYVISLFSCVLCHFYLSWAVVIFVCLYAGCYCLFNRENAKRFAFSFIVGSVIAAFLSMIVIIPCFIQYTRSMRGGNVLDNLKRKDFFPPYQTSVPTFFCLLLTLPFAFYFRKKEGVSYKQVLFILTLVPAVVEPISAAWQTFDYMAFPTRYGFITIVLGLTLGAQKLNQLLNQPVKHPVLVKGKAGMVLNCIFSLAIIVCTAFFIRQSFVYLNANKADLSAYSKSLWGNDKSFALLSSYYVHVLTAGIILLVLTRFRWVNKIAVYAVIGALCIVEAVFSCTIYMVAPANDYTEFKQAIELSQAIDDDEFYRVKTHYKYFDVNLVGALGFNSMSHYTSLNRESYMMMAKQMGYSSYWMEVNSNGGTKFTDALMRNKYIIKNIALKNGEPVYPENAVITSEKYSVIPNDTVLPFGFLVDGGGSVEISDTIPRWKIQNDLARRILGVDLYEELKYDNLVGVEQYEGYKNYNFRRINQEDGVHYIMYKVKVEGKKTLYFDCFDRYSNALKESTYSAVSTIRVYNSNRPGGFAYGTYPTQARNGVLELGTFEDATVTIYVYLNKNINYNSFGVFSFDDEKLESVVNERIGGDFTFNKGKISGKITSDSNGKYLLFSLPFDEGYSARVNGKKVSVINFNGLLAVEVNEGENTVKIGFVPEGFYIGLIAFLLGGALLVLYYLFANKISEIKFVKTLGVIAVFCLFAIILIAIYFAPALINVFAKYQIA